MLLELVDIIKKWSLRRALFQLTAHLDQEQKRESLPRRRLLQGDWKALRVEECFWKEHDEEAY